MILFFHSSPSLSQPIPENLADWGPLILRLQDRSILAKCLSYLDERELDFQIQAYCFPAQKKSKTVHIKLTDAMLESQKLDPTFFPDCKPGIDPSIQTLTVSLAPWGYGLLDFSISNRETMHWNFVLTQAAHFFPEVREIRINGLSLSPQFFTLLKDFNNLETLSLFDVDLFWIPRRVKKDSDFLISEESLPLKCLSITEAREFSPQTFHHLAKRLPHLERLSLSMIKTNLRNQKPLLDLSSLKALQILQIDSFSDPTQQTGWAGKWTSDGSLRSLTEIDLLSKLKFPDFYFCSNLGNELLESLSTFPALQTLLSGLTGKACWRPVMRENYKTVLRFALDRPGERKPREYPLVDLLFTQLKTAIPPFLDKPWAQTFWAYTLAANKEWEEAVTWALQMQKWGNREGIQSVAEIMSAYARDVGFGDVKPHFERLLDQARHYAQHPLLLEEERELRDVWLNGIVLSHHSFSAAYDADKNQLIHEALTALENLGGTNPHQWTAVLSNDSFRRSLTVNEFNRLSELWWQAVSHYPPDEFTSEDLRGHLYLYTVLISDTKSLLWVKRFIESPAASLIPPIPKSTCYYKDKILYDVCKLSLSLPRETRIQLMDLIEPILCKNALRNPIVLHDCYESRTIKRKHYRQLAEELIREHYVLLYPPEEIEKRMNKLMHISSTPQSQPPQQPPLEVKEGKEPVSSLSLSDSDYK